MTDTPGDVIGGVDTHADTHHAAVIDRLGRHLADRSFDATSRGYRSLLGWLESFGTLAAIGVEGTGSYGAGLCAHLRRAGRPVVEVDRPDRRRRRQVGKSDPIDAYAAAQAVLAQRATTVPKTRTAGAEAIRVLRTVRASAIKSRTQATNQIHALITTAPAALREQLTALPPTHRAAACTRLNRPRFDAAPV